ncbi:hypothetical protein PTKIN_Ptkin09bG0240300 [Pterospermum kingtungense]
MASESYSEPSSSRSRWNHDVFLSFRGDTRKIFTGHLYTALISAGIHTFIDNEELCKGEDISSELLRAIEESRIAVVVFSKNYASSWWCLNELVKIMECKKSTRKMVLPIFYDVDPSDVRHQKGTYAEAFAMQEDRFKDKMEIVEQWRAALKEAADLSGWDLQNFANGHEAKFIQKIVEHISTNILKRTPLNVAKYPVAIESRYHKVMKLLSVGNGEVRMVGIYGMGGIGKTTLAKAVYNTLYDKFEGSSFLADIKDRSKRPVDLVDIQEQLLSDMTSKKRLRIDNVDKGINLIKKRLGRKRVLIVLDDVSQARQLHSLVGERNWFGLGSRIIVTTRDERLVTELEADERYKVEELESEESVQLVSWHAFRKPNPEEDYLQLCKNVVHYTGGLPLALEVLGSSLFKRSKLEWERAVAKLRRIPHHQIQSKLRISFDALDDDEQKDIFLDIACFFIGMDIDCATKILDGCGFFPEISISILIERSLVAVNRYNELAMHDLLRDMGREIVREMSPNHAGKRSRLWFHEDVVQVLQKCTGTKAVEGIVCDLLALKDTSISTEAFAKMISLRLLKINHVCLSGCYGKVSKELRWLCWKKCPLEILPPNFHLDNLVVLDMQFSSLKKVWEEIKFLSKLKILNLSHSVCLTETPNFMGLTRLERLILEGCKSLAEIHQSIGNLEELVFLNLLDCKNLRKLPDSICNLRSIETIILEGCSELSSLPENFGNLKTLTELKLAGKTTILRLPASFSGLSSLTKLHLSNCNLSDDAVSTDFGSFPFLTFLDLRGNKFHKLPTGIYNLSKLRELILRNCSNLQSIQELPPNLWVLNAKNCTSLETVSISSNVKEQLSLHLTNCSKLTEIQGFESLPSIQFLQLGRCHRLSNSFRSNLSQVSLFFPLSLTQIQV